MSRRPTTSSVCWPFCNMIFIVIFYLYYIQSAQSAHCLLSAALAPLLPKISWPKNFTWSAHNFNKANLCADFSSLSLFHSLSIYLCLVCRWAMHIQFGFLDIHCHFIWKTCCCRNEANFQFKLWTFALHLMACCEKKKQN